MGCSRLDDVDTSADGYDPEEMETIRIAVEDYIDLGSIIIDDDYLGDKKWGLELIEIAENYFENKKIIFPKEWSIFKKLFNEKNLSRKECLRLPFKTLSKAFKN